MTLITPAQVKINLVSAIVFIRENFCLEEKYKRLFLHSLKIQSLSRTPPDYTSSSSCFRYLEGSEKGFEKKFCPTWRLAGAKQYEYFSIFNFPHSRDEKSAK